MSDLPGVSDMDLLKDKYYHSIQTEGDWEHCGHVIGAVNPGYYLVRYYDPNAGHFDAPRIVPITELEECFFFPTENEMRDSWNNSKEWNKLKKRKD